MGILQALFGSQMGQTGINTGFTPVNPLPQTQTQQAPQTLGLVQDILSQRFQPQGQDVANSIFMNGTGLGTNGGITTPEVQTLQRLAPVLDVAKTLGTLNQSQLEIAKLSEMMRHDQATELQNPFSQPITTSPTTAGGALPPSQTIPSGNIPSRITSNFVPQTPTSQSIPQVMQGNATDVDTRPATSEREANALSALTGGAGDRVADMSMAQPPANGTQPQPPTTQGNGLTPLYKGNVPFKDGLPDGYQWAQNAEGKQVAMQIPGVPQKGANGELLTTDAQGNTTQTIPQNPVMRQKFEQNLQLIAKKFDEIKQAGGSVEEGGSFLDNKINQAVSDIPGGQALAQGSKAQTIRDEIKSLIKQTTPLYMQAMGITPGMERAVSAQQMLQDALGGALGKSRQQNMFSLANLSRQAGTGELASQIASPQSAQTQIDPTVTRQHAQDAIKAGAPRQAVLDRLTQMGISTEGL